MGRRSTFTTKSGKFMNPTDQARKEARKRELKKNKKQRKLVRETVLKLKDPKAILEEMLKIDLLEIDAGPVPLPNDKAMKEKRKKLKETLDRILKLYERQEKEKYEDIKKFQGELEVQRQKALLQYQTKLAQQQEEERQRLEAEEAARLSLPEIPLPHSGKLLPSDIPLPIPAMSYSGMGGLPAPPGLPPGSVYGTFNIPGLPPGLIPPGPPPGPPIELSDDEEEDFEGGDNVQQRRATLGALEGTEDSYELEGLEEMEGKLREEDDAEGDSSESEESDISDDEDAGKRRAVRFAKAAEVKEFVDETEEERTSVQQTLLRIARGGDEGDQEDESSSESVDEDDIAAKQDDGSTKFQAPMPTGPPAPPLGMPPGPPPGMPNMGQFPPRMPPSMPLGAPPRVMPPGPPPGRPPGPPPGVPPPRPPALPPNIPLPPPPRGLLPGMPPPSGTVIRPLPPGFPPGVPILGPALPGPTLDAQAILVKPPELHKAAPEDKDSSTISAKPQLRNMRAEVTKLVPTALRVRREAAGRQKVKKSSGQKSMESGVGMLGESAQRVSGPTKDDVYAQFMNEMEELL